MRTSLPAELLQTADGKQLDEILRKCVHCGFCNATCPTYQLTGDELDGPRGRIYLIKNYFENSCDKSTARKHLDRCLTCLSCETTCPSNVRYGDLLDIGRKHICDGSGRPILNKIKRYTIASVLSKPRSSALIFALARFFKPLLPEKLAKKIPQDTGAIKTNAVVTGSRKMLTIRGCVQFSAAPQINAAAAQVLGDADIQLDESESDCCGALAFHLTEIESAYKTIRRNIDDWYQRLKSEHEFLILTSSGCSSFVKKYGAIMRPDPQYAQRAQSIAKNCRDLSEICADLHIKPAFRKRTIAFHNPCTLQHNQQITSTVETTIQKAGYTLVPVSNRHLCCGSAGSYSLLETELSHQLLTNKIHDLTKAEPDMIATANIGCLMHLQSGTDIPVKHWIELLV
ncbi:MAG: glycolate oxidase subunit GlcF [Gammaproteobacteria bacterium]|nr:glycolate oxidase subunit GlcF [Gammaproteobacteria bacterium]